MAPAGCAANQPSPDVLRGVWHHQHLRVLRQQRPCAEGGRAVSAVGLEAHHRLEPLALSVHQGNQGLVTCSMALSVSGGLLDGSLVNLKQSNTLSQRLCLWERAGMAVGCAQKPESQHQGAHAIA